MKGHYKRNLKIYIIPVFFIAVSFAITTFAWFSYSGLKRVSADVDIQSWYIEISKDGEPVTNNIVISLDDIYPGMEPVTELVKIQNKGDSIASLSYNIQSARVFDDNVNLDSSLLNDRTLESILSHDYPFHININLSKNYLKNDDEEVSFEVSISWPLDSGSDNIDSQWGKSSYDFQASELDKHDKDNSYVVRPAIQIIIELAAEQYLETNDVSDMSYNLGDVILYDVIQDKKCSAISESCLSTNVIDVNNKLGDSKVVLLPTLYGNYISDSYDNYKTILDNYTSSWNVETRELLTSDIIKIISHDIFGSTLEAGNISPQLIGYISDQYDFDSLMAKFNTFNGSFKFMNHKFSFLVSNNCYWTYVNSLNGYIVSKLNSDNSVISRNSSDRVCNVVPVILASKSNL